MMKKKIVSLGLVMLLAMSMLCGCGDSRESSTADQPSETTTATDDIYDDVTLDGMTDDILAGMSLKQKIGQMFIVSTDSLDPKAETETTDTMLAALKEYNPGGVVLFSFNLKTRKQVMNFISDMQATASIPMFIAVDEEGGSVARVANNEKMKTTVFPSMMEIGNTGDTEKAYQLGKTVAEDISALGFNLDFAPVCDVLSNPDNTEIGDRSFGSDPQLVASMIEKEIRGLHVGGVATTLKHFPGQGSSDADTHKGYSDLDVTIDVLRNREFTPFKAGINAKSDLVMVSHVALSDITTNEEPASLSQLMVSEILRDELGYDGVVITDAMNMKVITKFYSASEAAVKAVEAGDDIILMPDDLPEAFNGIQDAISEGRLTEEQIDEAVGRIIKVKLLRQIINLSIES